MAGLIGPRGLAEGKVEVKKRAGGTRDMMSPAAALDLLSKYALYSSVRFSDRRSAENLCAAKGFGRDNRLVSARIV